VQTKLLNLPEETWEKVTLPEGTEIAPPPTSWTIAVHVLLELTGSAAGLQPTAIVDGRFETASAKLFELPSWLESPWYDAVRLWVPSEPSPGE
jgi:hypothetical protein